MIGGRTVVDVHVHAPRLSTLRPAWLDWADTFSRDHDWRSAYRENGDPEPAALDALFAEQGVDHVMLFSEYSPRATGIQPFDDLLPLVQHNPQRFHPVANINPHLHFPLVGELQRQVDLGAVALKLHPVHAGFDPGDRELFPVYAKCAELGIPVIYHSGTSSFPGSRNKYGNPELYLDAIDCFPEVNFVFAHGGRGWWYEAAAFLVQAKPNVWIDLAGLPPKKLPDYYGASLPRIASKMLFGTDWPGVPGPRTNVDALGRLGFDEATLAAVVAGNASRVFPRAGITLETSTSTRKETTDE
ncbi:amidohydrolase family protein [Gordonia phthalatica]|uniref:Amidohydrolase n=1 Tax=Gordonia phthalatica TaxID=1136941 RepID=A0A0N9MQU3_9ACTN|nr:amidohydrolase family protein [Gordonia phthalatica]ALG85283.1 amidohydrolase [Gordonia phthalatica]